MFGQDLRYAVRQLRMSPGFTLTAVLTLALGIGALTTVATWTNAVLFNPWPQVRDARSLRFVSATVLGGDGYSVNYSQLQYLRQQGRSFSDAAAFDIATLNLALPNTQPQAIPAGTVSSNYFQLLGVKPEVGTFFQPNADDHAFGSMDAIVLSDGLWRDRFNADPSVIGRTVDINRHVFTVIGVAPREFAGIFGGVAEAAWVPLSALRDLSADAPPDPLLHAGLQVVLRLRPNVTDSAAKAELHTLARSFALAQHNDQFNSWDLNLYDSAHFQRGFFWRDRRSAACASWRLMPVDGAGLHQYCLSARPACRTSTPRNRHPHSARRQAFPHCVSGLHRDRAPRTCRRACRLGCQRRNLSCHLRPDARLRFPTRL